MVVPPNITYTLCLGNTPLVAVTTVRQARELAAANCGSTETCHLIVDEALRLASFLALSDDIKTCCLRWVLLPKRGRVVA